MKKYIVGKTLVQVFKKTINSKTGSENTSVIHEGVVTNYTVDKGGNPAFIQIFNQNLRKGQGYQTKELFAENGKLIWVKPVGELKYQIDVSLLN